MLTMLRKPECLYTKKKQRIINNVFLNLSLIIRDHKSSQKLHNADALASVERTAYQ